MLVAFFASYVAAMAQVHIGSNLEPEDFSVLQLTGTDGGLRVNQLDSEAITVLQESIKASNKLEAAQGLLVWNTTESCYNMFKDEEFVSLCANSPLAVFDPDDTLLCGSLQVFGEYEEAKSLDANNYLTLDVLCTKAGSYSFAGTVRNANGKNGYAFSKGDVLLETGRHSLTIYCSGTPINPGIDTLVISLNRNEYICPDGLIAIKPAPQRAVYQIQSAEQIGNHFNTSTDYVDNETNAIKVKIKVTQSGLQTELHARINGLEFKYTPEDNSFWEVEDGQETAEYDIILKTTGNAFSYGIHSGTVTGLSGKTGDAAVSPKVDLLFLSRPIRILGVSDSFYNMAYTTGSTQNLPYQMLSQPGSFIYKDAQNPGQYIENITFKIINRDNLSLAELNAADIVNMAVPRHPSNNTNLVNFVKNKQGVLLFFGEGGTTADATMIKAITGETVTLGSTGSAGVEYPFISVANDPIIDGHFGSLSGKYWGEDASTTNCITSAVPSRFVVYSLNNYAGNNTGKVTNPTCFRDSQLGFIWNGDGGFLSNLKDATAECCYPFNIDATTKLPAGKPSYTPAAYNSLFIANSVWWAIDFLRANGRID